MAGEKDAEGERFGLARSNLTLRVSPYTLFGLEIKRVIK